MEAGRADVVPQGAFLVPAVRRATRHGRLRDCSRRRGTTTPGRVELRQTVSKVLAEPGGGR